MIHHLLATSLGSPICAKTIFYLISEYPITDGGYEEFYILSGNNYLIAKKYVRMKALTMEP